MCTVCRCSIHVTFCCPLFSEAFEAPSGFPFAIQHYGSEPIGSDWLHNYIFHASYIFR